MERRVLRNELAGFTGVYSALKAFNVEADDLFFSMKCKVPEYTEGETQCLYKYWHNPNPFHPADGYIELPSPSTDYFLALYSRNAWKYPWGGVTCKLPAVPRSGAFYPIGFEPGSGDRAGLSSFGIGSTGFRALCDGRAVIITDYLPANYTTVAHDYYIKVNEGTTEFYIDDELVAICIRTDIDFTTIAGPPYEIFGSSRKGFIEGNAFIEFYASEVSRYDLDHQAVKAMNGDRCPLRNYRLYETGTETLWAGMAVTTATTVTSHPFPLIGYTEKTVDFEADCAGRLLIDVLMRTGNWAEYTLNSGIAIDADVLKRVSITGEEVLGRLRFTPDANGVITDAEVHLR